MRAVLVVVAVFAAACNRDAEPGACHRDRDSACTEYEGPRAAAAKKMCVGFRWIPGRASCPTEGRIGDCVREDGAIVEHVYGGPPNHYTPEVARRVCESTGGVFR